MEHKHLDAAALEDLLAMDRTAKQNEQLFHLLAVCPRCREVGGWLLALHQANALPPVFGPIDAALARSRAEAPHLLQELLPLDPEERLARLHTDHRFVSGASASCSSAGAAKPRRGSLPRPSTSRTLPSMWRTGQDLGKRPLRGALGLSAPQPRLGRSRERSPGPGRSHRSGARLRHGRFLVGGGEQGHRRRARLRAHPIGPEGAASNGSAALSRSAQAARRRGGPLPPR
jgi:hypothetical protein